MRLPHFRIRTLMVVVGVVALLIWGAMMGTRSYDSYRQTREYGEQERGWRSIASRGRWDSGFALQCAEYNMQLTRKYRRAMWRPWMPVEPDPHAPGYDQMMEQNKRLKEVPSDSGTPEVDSSQGR